MRKICALFILLACAQAHAADATGSLRVVTNTPSAQVLIDGETAGAANTDLGNLKPGHHAIELRAPGYESKYFEQDIVAGEQRIAQMELKRVGEADAPPVDQAQPDEA